MKFFKILLLSVFSLVWADDYDEFEKSLMEEPTATVAAKQVVPDSSEDHVVKDTSKPAFGDERYWKERTANKEKNIQVAGSVIYTLPY